MSVVNRMLRDLDQREAGNAHGIYTQQLAGIDAPSAWRRPLVVILIVVALGAAAWWGWNRYAAAPDAAVAKKPAPTQVAAKAAPAAPAEDTTNATAAAETADAASATDTPERAPADGAEATDPHAATDAAAPIDAAAQAPAAVMPDAPAAAGTAATPAPVPTANASTAATARHATRPAVTARAAKPQAAVAAAEPAEATGHIDVRPHLAGADTAQSEFQRAVALIGQGRHEEARAALRAALHIDPAHEGARQTLATLLMEIGKANEAAALLDEGLRLNPAQINFAIVLARLHLDQGDRDGALKVLRAHDADAKNNPEYHAFVAALLRRNGQATEAVIEYRTALTLAPRMGTWWVGLGLSYEAAGQPQEALQAYERARALGNLPPAVADLVQGKLQTVH